VSSATAAEVEQTGGSETPRHSRNAVWPFSALLAANFLSVPATLASIYLSSTDDYYVFADNYLIPALFAVVLGQLFLLAFWMSFGSWPRRWRSLVIFAITSGVGLVFGIGAAAIEFIEGWDDGFSIAVDDLILMAVIIPIFAATFIWITNALFALPAWYFPYEISRRISETSVKLQPPTFGMVQLFIWMGQVAIPLGLLQAITLLTDSEEDLFILVAPYVFLMTCVTPISIAALKPRFSFIDYGIACLWSLTAAVTYEFAVSDDWLEALPGWSFLFLCLTIATNLFVLRCMGLGWRPRIATTSRPHA
jgi:hypothetical protein